MYEYRAELVRVVDGDTIDVRIDMGLDIYTQQRLRLYGLNAPEMSTAAGKEAKVFVTQWFDYHTSPGAPFTIDTVKDKREKYGRYLATVTALDGNELNRELIDTGHAVVYMV